MYRGMNRGLFQNDHDDGMSITLNIRCNEKTPRHIEINLFGDDVSRNDMPKRENPLDPSDLDDFFPDVEKWTEDIPPRDEPETDWHDEWPIGLDPYRLEDDCPDVGNEADDVTTSIVKIEFDYKDNLEEALAQLNGMLGARKLTDVELQDFNGYLFTQYEYDPDREIRQFVPGTGILVCKTQKDAEAFSYQIATNVLEDAPADLSEYRTRWHEAHPEHQIRSLILQNFEKYCGVLILYHERTADFQA